MTGPRLTTKTIAFIAIAALIVAVTFGVLIAIDFFRR